MSEALGKLNQDHPHIVGELQAFLISLLMESTAQGSVKQGQRIVAVDEQGLRKRVFD